MKSRKTTGPHLWRKRTRPDDERALDSRIKWSLFSKASSISSALEIGIVALLASVLFVTLVVIVPYIAIREALAAGRPGIAFLIGAVIVTTGASLARDLKARRWSWISKGVAMLWLGCVLYVLVRIL